MSREAKEAEPLPQDERATGKSPTETGATPPLANGDSQASLPGPSASELAGNQPDLTRRRLLIGGGLAAGGIWGYSWWQRHNQRVEPVFIARQQRYDGALVGVIRDGLLATGLAPDWVRGKRVLLKPNLVEPTRTAPHMTTHPAVIVATAEVFRGWGAQVTVGEGPGHLRDTELALDESGVGEALESAELTFADLNYQEVAWRPNVGRRSGLPGLYLPQAVVEADLLVSLPKLKTHHWMGVTCAMKNLYGVMPGSQYGWPKNVLHHHGIPATVYDINASLPPTIAVVDAIDCMEGDGPIMGSRKRMGLLLVGCNPVAVDATACRLMQILPERIDYLSLANRRLGPLDEAWIEQRGEAWRPLASPFELLDKPHLSPLRAPGILVS